MNYLSIALIFSILIWHLLHGQTFFIIWGLMIAVYSFFNFRMTQKSPNSFWQKFKIASFNSPGDPCVYSREEIDITDIEILLEKYNKAHPDERLTLTHVVAKAIGTCMASTKQASGVMSFGHFKPFDSVDVSVLVDIGGNNLGTVVVKNCDKISISEIAKQLKGSVSKLKKGEDKDMNEQIKKLSLVPSFLAQAIARVSSWIVYDLGLDLPALKLKKYNFGVAILTNISTMGQEDTTAPLVPFCKAVMVAVMNTPVMKPLVIDNEIKIRKTMNINTSFDHRFADGVDASVMFKKLREVILNVENHLI